MCYTYVEVESEKEVSKVSEACKKCGDKGYGVCESCPCDLCEIGSIKDECKDCIHNNLLDSNNHLLQ